MEINDFTDSDIGLILEGSLYLVMDCYADSSSITDYAICKQMNWSVCSELVIVFIPLDEPYVA